MDLTYEEIREYHALHAYVEEHFQEGKANYLFVDEVQMCLKFEVVINSLYSKGKYIEIHVFPFGFQEYCQYYDETDDKEKLFDEYSIKGGLAGSYAYRTEKDRINYVKEVYETIVTRDLVQKYSSPDTLVLQRLSEFLMDYGRVYENMVCIELLRRGYDVHVRKLYQKEIDFVAQKGSPGCLSPKGHCQDQAPKIWL